MVHILSDIEIKVFFKEVDGYVPAVEITKFSRQAILGFPGKGDGFETSKSE